MRRNANRLQLRYSNFLEAKSAFTRCSEQGAGFSQRNKENFGTARFFAAPRVWSRTFKPQKAEPKAVTKESCLMLARTGLLAPGIATFRTENLQ